MSYIEEIEETIKNYRKEIEDLKKGILKFKNDNINLSINKNKNNNIITNIDTLESSRYQEHSISYEKENLKLQNEIIELKNQNKILNNKIELQEKTINQFIDKISFLNDQMKNKNNNVQNVTNFSINKKNKNMNIINLNKENSEENNNLNISNQEIESNKNISFHQSNDHFISNIENEKKMIEYEKKTYLNNKNNEMYLNKEKYEKELINICSLINSDSLYACNKNSCKYCEYGKICNF